ncbi:MAG: hypothetical protein ACREDR_19325 [Blastocatellia bacterium]
MRRLLFQAMLAAWCAPAAFGQNPAPEDYPKLEAFAGYSVIGRANTSVTDFGPIKKSAGLSSPTGFETSTIGNLNRWIGFKGDLSGYFGGARNQAPIRFCSTCPIELGFLHFRTRMFESMGGPEVKARNSTRWTPFGHTLLGVAHATARITATSNSVNLSEVRSDNAFAMAMGGGIDFRIATRVSLRFSVDYNPVFFGSNDTVASHRQDFVRFSIGVLFH